ncbi:MAG TPA: hypothetical protein VFA10_30910 [Ktedonobacteraceae bacterium]|nr:hypothetical protein [Ktedonobacteraceae bacterium]
MFNRTSYRRGVIEGIALFTLGRLGMLIDPAIFPDWTYIAVPLLFVACRYLAPVWVTRRIASTKRERLSKRFWLLGPYLASLCLGVDLLITLAIGFPARGPISGWVPQGSGPALVRLFSNGADHLSVNDLGLYALITSAFLLALFTLTVVCTRLAQGGFLRFTMPAGGNRVTL